MINYTVQIQNNSGSDKAYKGVPIADSANITITSETLLDQLKQDQDLITDILAGDIVINNGNSNLSAKFGVLHLREMPVVISAANSLPTNPYHGQKVWAYYDNHDGVYYYDSVRSKWLSEEKEIFEFATDGDSTATQLVLEWKNGIAGSEGGPQIKENATIVGFQAGVRMCDTGVTARFFIASLQQNGFLLIPFNPTIYLDLAYTSSIRIAKDFTINQNINKTDRVVALRKKQVGGREDIIGDPSFQVMVRYRLGPSLGELESEVVQFNR
jgi:hypothetical protein